jgi:hypothetical protein
MMVLLWKKQGPAVDIMLYCTLTLAATNVLCKGMLVFSAYNSMCVENGLVREKSFLERTVFSSEMF